MPTVLSLHAPGPRGVPLLLSRLADYGGLFPPSVTSLADAVQRYLAARRQAHGGMIGFLLCPTSRLGALVVALRKAPPPQPVALSLIADNGLGGLPKAISTALDNEKLLDLRMIEVPAPAEVDATWLVQLTEFVPDDVVRVVEPRRGRPEWLDGVRLVAEAGCWPKLRCGGKSTESFPSVDEVAAFLAIATSTGRPFKATAGLHHAVRHHDESTGLTHHGLLNLLVGTARAVSGDAVSSDAVSGDAVSGDAVSGDGVREALLCTDGAALAAEANALSEDSSRAVREVFACYGSASLTAPIADLIRLGLLPDSALHRRASGG